MLPTARIFSPSTKHALIVNERSSIPKTAEDSRPNVLNFLNAITEATLFYRILTNTHTSRADNISLPLLPTLFICFLKSPFHSHPRTPAIHLFFSVTLPLTDSVIRQASLNCVSHYPQARPVRLKLPAPSKHIAKLFSANIFLPIHIDRIQTALTQPQSCPRDEIYSNKSQYLRDRRKRWR